MSSIPSISVITATVDRRELLLRKLESLQAQTLASGTFEWIVCVNGGDPSIAEAIEASGSRFDVSVVRLADNCGPGGGRNACAEVARGTVLYLSDDDCLLAPDTLELHLKAQERPCVGVGAIDFVPPGSPPRSWRPRRVGYWNVNGANTSIPADEFRAVGGFDPSLEGYGGEDLLLGYRLARRGLPLRALPEARVEHIGEEAMAGDVEKACSAGANAARISLLHPELAWRLGVHPALLALKKAVLPRLRTLGGARAETELAYARGAGAVLSAKGVGRQGSERR